MTTNYGKKGKEAAAGVGILGLPVYILVIGLLILGDLWVINAIADYFQG